MKIRKSDDFPAEARIKIDLETGHVDIDHITERRGRYWIAKEIIFPTIFSLSYSICLIFLPLLIAYPLILFIEGHYLGYIILISMIFVFMYSSIILSYPLSFLPGFNRYIFPLIGAIANYFSGDGTTIFVTELDNNKFIIPMFKNAFLKYTCYGDYNKCIKKIEITESPLHFIQKKIGWRCNKWQAIFEFKRQPMNGGIEILYI